MSKRKINLGKVYRIEDGSGYAHPGMPFKGYKKKGKYDVVKFTTSTKKSYPLNSNPTKNPNNKSRVRKRPERVGDDFIKREIIDFKIIDKSDKKLIQLVKRNPIKDRTKKKK